MTQHIGTADRTTRLILGAVLVLLPLVAGFRTDLMGATLARRA